MKFKKSLTFIVIILLTTFFLTTQAHLINESESTFRIVGGEKIEESTEFPYFGSLFYNGLHHPICGCFIIGDTWILTAAHCVKGLQIEDFHVVVGQINLDQEGERINIENILIHPDYKEETLSNDFAFLKVNKKFNVHQQANLISEFEMESSKKVTVIGYGMTYEDGPISNHLLKANLTIYNQNTCYKKYEEIEFEIKPSMICAKGAEKGSCYGDSGGPLVEAGNKKNVLGVTSFGYGCAHSKYPGIYGRVSEIFTFFSKIRQE